MYRQYENPYRLEKCLSELQGHRWKMIDHGADKDAIINLDKTIAELKGRRPSFQGRNVRKSISCCKAGSD